MSRTVYLNGDYIQEENATVSIFDRGFLFADGVYEVTAVLDGKLIDFSRHVERLKRSLKELEIKLPMAIEELLEIHRKLIRLNDIDEGMIYLQITRGVASDRDIVYPGDDIAPTVVLFTQNKLVQLNSGVAKAGIKVISIKDQRWGRRDIKTTQLLYSSMGKMMAKKAGCDDAWMVEDGHVTEGTSNNACIVKNETIITRQLGKEILAGVTRAAVLRFALEARMKVEERPFTLDEAKTADEAFITSSTNFVMPVVEIDGEAIGNGKPGPIATRLRDIYLEQARKTAI